MNRALGTWSDLLVGVGSQQTKQANQPSWFNDPGARIDDGVGTEPPSMTTSSQSAGGSRGLEWCMVPCNGKFKVEPAVWRALTSL